MQSSTKMLGTAVAAGLLFVASHQASASLTLQYDTWPDTGGTVTNTGNSGVNGTIIDPSAASYANTGPDDGTLTPPHASAHFGPGHSNGLNNATTGVNTNSTYDSLVGSNGDMTMSAWVNLDAGGTSNDHFVFGTVSNNGQGLHLGFRNGQAYFGFWGNDSAQNVSSSSSIVGNWHYFSWVYDSTGNGTQSIYEDGSLLGSSGGHGKYVNGGNLIIGSTDFSNGNIDGSLDDVRVYNTAFSAADVANLYSDSSKPDTPEPASLGLLGVGAIGLLARRRRD